MRRYGYVRSIISPLITRRSSVPFIFLPFVSTLIYVSMVTAMEEIGAGDNDGDMNVTTTTYVSSDGVKSGQFTSPGFPGKYRHNTRSVYHFRAAPEEVVWITWSVFKLEEPFSANGLCMRDYVEIIVIDYHNVQHVSGRYCGRNKPPEFKTMQQSVDIIFQSSYTKEYQGFNGTYEFIHESKLPPPASRYTGKENPEAYGCGGIAKGVFGGVIKSPGYPETYPENIECNWVIRVEPGKKVYVRILELQLTTSKTDCAQAQLSVIDGYAHYIYENNTRPHDKHMVQFCGEEKYYKDQGARSYMSTRNRMVVRFNTTQLPKKEMYARREDYGSPIGFYLVWTEVLPLDEKNDNSVCDKFLCRGGDYCLDETQTVCAERRRYCIDKSLLCDGIPNCGELDESDEENCYSKEIVAAGASLFLLLVLIIVAVICCQRHRGRKRLEHIRRAAGHSARPTCAAPVNSVNANAFSSEDQLRRVPSICKGEANSTRYRTDIAAFPQNYHPARGSGEDNDEDNTHSKQPFLAVPNHVTTYAAVPTVPRTGVDQQSGRREKVSILPSDDCKEKSVSSVELGSIVRRRQGNASAAHPSTCVPLIKVLTAEGGDGRKVKGATGEQARVVYPEGACPIHSKANADKWTYDSSKQGPHSAQIRTYIGEPSGGDPSSQAVEMVTFSSANTSTGQRAAAKPQGILKSSTSLPGSGDRRDSRTYASVGTPNAVGHAAAKSVCVPAPPPPPDASDAAKPPPPSYSQALARLGRQKAVEFVDELPRRRETSHEQSQMPPLMLIPPGARLANDEADGAPEDRSPSPWHRLKPSIV